MEKRREEKKTTSNSDRFTESIQFIHMSKQNVLTFPLTTYFMHARILCIVISFYDAQFRIQLQDWDSPNRGVLLPMFPLRLYPH